MKTGVCENVIGTTNLRVLQTNADYLECNFACVASATEEQFQDAFDFVKSNSINVYSANCMFKDITLFGDNASSKSEISEYLKVGFSRFGRLGGKIVVLGSGNARMVPKNLTFEQAYRQLLDLAYLIGEIANSY